MDADASVLGQLFVFTLGYSRRLFTVAFPQQRMREWLAGHELAFQHFGGVPDRIVVDNAKAMVLTHTRDAIVWNPTYAISPRTTACGRGRVRRTGRRPKAKWNRA